MTVARTSASQTASVDGTIDGRRLDWEESLTAEMAIRQLHKERPERQRQQALGERLTLAMRLVQEVGLCWFVHFYVSDRFWRWWFGADPDGDD